jgi:hypothetical protein
MHFISKKAAGIVASVALGLSGAGIVMATVASASTTVTATTTLADHPDSGNNGDWANDNFTRVASVTSLGEVTGSVCAPLASPCFSYSGSLSDSGSFTTISGADSPNVGTPISGVQTGSFEGGQPTFDFYATSGVVSATAIPPSMDGPPTIGSSVWLTEFFPGGTTFAVDGALSTTLLPTWSWGYNDFKNCQAWTDAYTGDTVGDITGVGNCVVSITNPGTQETHSGDAASLQILASTTSSDPALTYSMSGNPAGLSINPSTGLITGTPTTVENTDIVRVNVTDAVGDSSHVYFAWDVTNAQVPDDVTDSYVCGHSSPRAQFRLTVPTGTYTVQVRMTEVRKFTGAVVGDGTIFVHPGHSYIINANDSVALRIYYQANGFSGPVVFKFARVPSALVNQHNC